MQSSKDKVTSSDLGNRMTVGVHEVSKAVSALHNGKAAEQASTKSNQKWLSIVR